MVSNGLHPDRRRLASAFNAWVDKWETSQHVLQVLQRVAASLMNRALRAAFLTWVDSVEQDVAERGLLRKMAGIMRNLAAHAAFNTWATEAFEAKELMAKMHKAARVVCFPSPHLILQRRESCASGV